MPVIDPDNFEAVRTIMRPHMTHTYNEWLNLCAKWRADYGSDGVVNVDVNPNKFSKFVADSGRAPDMQALLIFCEPKTK